MSWIIRAISLIAFVILMSPMAVSAQVRPATPTITEAPTPTTTPEPTPTPEPPSATQQTTSRLQQLVEQADRPLSVGTALQHTARLAVQRGVPADVVVLLFLFPVVATLIATARHLLGLRGFGIFTPAMLSVTFLVTGLRLGMTLLLFILVLAMVSRYLMRWLRLQYLPQMAMLILAMSLGLLAAMAGVSQLGGVWEIREIGEIGVFPVLLLVILTENFISAQISHGLRTGLRMSGETLVLAVVSYLVMNLSPIQEWVVVHPEWTVALLVAGNILLGRYTGLRLLEYWRFRELLRR